MRIRENTMKYITVTWKDATFYHLGHIPSGCSCMETSGVLLKETDKYILIGKPKSIRRPDGKPYPETSEPKYFLIPKGMVETMKEIDEKLQR